MRHGHIVIEGNIGAGKTSLAEKIAKRNNTSLLLEERFNVGDNPYLHNFYRIKDDSKYTYSLGMELTFLAARQKQQKCFFNQKHEKIVSDYSFPHKCHIFGSVNLKGDDINLYKELSEILEESLPKPDLLVYIIRQTPELLLKINNRNRPNEAHITGSYLESVEKGYLDYLKSMKNQPILIINISDMDFLDNESDYQKIFHAINQVYPPGVTQLENEVIKELKVA